MYWKVSEGCYKHHTIHPEVDMNGKEGLYIFITAVWGILILITDYSNTTPFVQSLWFMFGVFLIAVSIYLIIMYCIYPEIIRLGEKFLYRFAEILVENLVDRLSWRNSIIAFLTRYIPNY